MNLNASTSMYGKQAGGFEILTEEGDQDLVGITKSHQDSKCGLQAAALHSILQLGCFKQKKKLIFLVKSMALPYQQFVSDV